jgi:hypothetical protein
VTARQRRPRERSINTNKRMLIAHTSFSVTPLYLLTCSEDALNEIRILASIKHKNIVR